MTSSLCRGRATTWALPRGGKNTIFLAEQKKNKNADGYNKNLTVIETGLICNFFWKRSNILVFIFCSFLLAYSTVSPFLFFFLLHFHFPPFPLFLSPVLSAHLKNVLGTLSPCVDTFSTPGSDSHWRKKRGLKVLKTV